MSCNGGARSQATGISSAEGIRPEPMREEVALLVWEGSGIGELTEAQPG